MSAATPLPEPFAGWFAGRGWEPHPHQRALLACDAPAALLIAPTGAGKTLAGFLPSLTELAARPAPGLHTLYISPLKALAADIARNLGTPVAEMGLGIRIEERTGDTAQSRRRRQRADPPQILLTTPESLALLLSQPEAPRLFAGLARVVIDEIHALAGTKRGDQLSLCLARLARLAPGHRRIGLSATVEDPAAIARWLAPERPAEILHAPPGPMAEIAILEDAGDPPWSGMGGRYSARAVMALIAAHRTSIVFINTRAQAELFFQALWAENADDLPIGLHHGSLGREARARVEAAMAAGALRAVVATASLDLGLDWGDVDLVVQVGAPKAVARLVQRIGRANHRYDLASKAVLVPANRFEVLECHAALDGVRAGRLDGGALPPGGRDVLAQHILLTACAGPFSADALFAEVQAAGAYAGLTRAAFDRCLDFCATGGYALRAYDQWQRLRQGPDGRWQLRDPRQAQRLRMNAGTIVGSETLSVQMGRRGGPRIGEVEEAFAATLTPGDTFLIGGRVVRYEGMRELTLQVSPATSREPKIAVFAGTKLATSVRLSHRVMEMLSDPAEWGRLPGHTRDWLELQRARSALPGRERLLVETFPRAGRWHLVVYAFAGRNACQTLGLILSRRMEAAGLAPLGFVATDYAVMLWGLREVADPAPLLAAEGLREGFEDWLASNAVMKRTFRNVAIVAGLIERQPMGRRKTGRQVSFSSDILYDTLRRYDPDHLLLDITREEALRGLVDFGRIEEMLARSAGRIRHVAAETVTPLAAPLLLEMGRVPIQGGSAEAVILEEAAALMAEIGLEGS
ncbi:ligase-associated DNA damage response DEXH box helicase [Paralimibaculum aggregatum]|uniref:Ligase-associated DNA damage response DEXH box helicase n=1 Tax=Paralimibaculum aggregatum TaxID=3036245 RepID=A0ABQ6LQC1_9RHOB|nr:ligase-associated DNA damage response DEXH box helicase [Limibaculum sp. NKW23]GMG83683.1 ligase-associated DNA damage response DEXH box helicase [Limibaculum sp. NKW23]